MPFANSTMGPNRSLATCAAVSYTHLAQRVLTGSTDVEQAGLEVEGHGQTGHDEGCCVGPVSYTHLIRSLSLFKRCLLFWF